MRVIRGNLSVLFVFSVLAVGVIVSGCAGNHSAEQSDKPEAGQIGTGTLTGRVKKVSGRCLVLEKDIICPTEPAPGVEIKVFTLSGRQIELAVSYDDGSYRIDTLHPGTYRVETGVLPGRQFSRTLPAIVTISLDVKATYLDIYIDTGIR